MIFHHEFYQGLLTVRGLFMLDLGRRCGYLPRQKEVEQEAWEPLPPIKLPS